MLQLAAQWQQMAPAEQYRSKLNKCLYTTCKTVRVIAARSFQPLTTGETYKPWWNQ